MNFKLIIALLFFITNCSTISYEKKPKLSNNSNKSTVSIHIGYLYYMDGELFDHPIQISDGIIDVRNDFQLIMQNLKYNNKLSFVEIDSPKSQYELEINVIFKNKMNFLQGILSGLTLTLIPSYYDTDLEIQGILYNRISGKKSKKAITNGKMRTYVGIFPLFSRIFSDSSKNREILIKNLLDNLLSDLEI
ncbi:hypothetical protein JWG40_06395 [Leptospira sp. 201903074]|nr:hypothetical protein [Leptospira abararensis]